MLAKQNGHFYTLDVLVCSVKMQKVLPDAQDGSSKQAVDFNSTERILFTTTKVIREFPAGGRSRKLIFYKLGREQQKYI